MNEASRFVCATLAMIILTLLTAMSPVLGAMAANLIRPAMELMARRSENLQRYVLRRARATPGAEQQQP